MTEIEDLLKAFQLHYGSLVYSKPQYTELLDRYKWLGRTYKNAVYEAVVSAHPMSLRSLPDVAVIEGAMRGMDRPEVYESPKEIEYVDVDNDASGRVAWLSLLDRMGSELGKRADEDGEHNHRERERIRRLIAKGEATEEEAFWIKAIDKYKGDWRLAYRTEGA